MLDDNYRALGYDRRLADAPYPNSAQLWPLRAAAAYVGLNAEAVANGIESGEIPVLMRTLGEQKKRFVNIAQLCEWATARAAAPAAGTEAAPKGAAPAQDESSLF